MSPFSHLSRRALAACGGRLAPLAVPLSLVAAASALLAAPSSLRSFLEGSAPSSSPPAAGVATRSLPAQPASPSSWSASSTRPWRLPMPAEQVLFLDEQRALARPVLARQLMVVDLATGDVELTTVLPQRSHIDHLARVGGRVLAFGEAPSEDGTDDAPMIWELSRPPGAPLTAVALPTPPGPSGQGPGSNSTVAISPDHRWIIWCDGERPATLRDASTLRVHRALRVRSCHDARFLSPELAVLGDQEVAIPGGQLRPKADEQYALAGPGGRVLRQVEPRSTAIVIAGGEVVQQGLEGQESYRWTPDGVAIALSDEAISLRPGRDGAPRTARPRLTGVLRDFDVNASHAILLQDSTLELVDLASGQSRTAEGNLSAVRGAAPFAGGVVTIADQLRVWSPQGELLAAQPSEITEVRATATRIAFLDDTQQVWSWDPASGAHHRLGAAYLNFRAPLAAAGDDVWFATKYTIERSRGGRPSQPVARFRHALNPVAIDPAGRVAWTEEPQLLHLVDLKLGAAYTMTLQEGCELVPEGLVDGLTVLRSDGAIHVKPDDGAATWTLRVPTQLGAAIAVSPGGEIAYASDILMLLWTPGAAEVRTWPSPLPVGGLVTSLDFSADGAHLAVGAANGEVTVIATAQVRARGEVRPAAPSAEPCIAIGPGRVSLGSLGLEIGPRAL